ncbi:serine/threonine protein phosphatase [Hymenobacter lapidiphilus]|uniref:metallophosphoesterase n=1 Tax=Hymenobacter sp. CCM 8763 TaxID=2303334 RepID=UPI000E340615|nr:metallophosphoesterase [Hymenobacter sp. CCM 8763]RFP63452.1 serine/threonine protein phosphatase [Hymenobacter sp. CCM 8763]
MNLFVIGDVHGCYHTFRAVLRHWQPKQELLVQVGDLVDRGHGAPECVALARELEATHPGRTVFLLGNHEHSMLRHYGPHGPHRPWLSWGGQTTVDQYRGRPKLLREHLDWLKERPLFWTNDQVVVSHAGFAGTPTPLEPTDPNGVLWRRGPLLALEGRRQVVGHTPTPDGEILLDSLTNALYVDTGAYLNRGLTGVRLSPAGDVMAEFRVPTSPLDIDLN